MRGWVDIATLAKPKNLNGGLVARGASGLPFLLYEGLELALVPPVIDAPRRVTITQAQDRSDREALVFFAEVPDLTAAEAIAGCHCLVREDAVDLSVLQDEEALPDWEGWTVHDHAEGLVGTVESVDERATQPLITVRRPNGAEALIPLAEDFLVNIDEDGRRIDMALPSGLLDL